MVSRWWWTQCGIEIRCCKEKNNRRSLEIEWKTFVGPPPFEFLWRRKGNSLKILRRRLFSFFFREQMAIIKEINYPPKNDVADSLNDHHLRPVYLWSQLFLGGWYFAINAILSMPMRWQCPEPTEKAGRDWERLNDWLTVNYDDEMRQTKLENTPFSGSAIDRNRWLGFLLHKISWFVRKWISIGILFYCLGLHPCATEFPIHSE